jgi:hypothetical protein
MSALYASAIGRIRIGVLAAGIVLTSSLAATQPAAQNVTWTNGKNVTASGPTLQKAGGCQGCEDSGATSREAIRSGDGFVEFTVGETNTFWLAGLNQGDGGTSYSDIDFAIRFNGAGQADVMESGAYQGGDTSYRAGDVFRVAIVNGRVQYSKNGQLMRESSKTPQYPLVLDAALGSHGATVQRARIATDERALTAVDARRDRFSRLDTNDDGVVSRSEWLGAGRAFDQRDVNGDGVLTRRELIRSGEEFGVATSGEMIRVSATDRWTNTGIQVRAGDRISFDANGSIRLSADGNDRATPAGAAGRFAPTAPFPRRPAGMLIARIDDSGPIPVGDLRVIARAPVSGTLYLGVNDDHLSDNNGEFYVSVVVER